MKTRPSETFLYKNWILGDILIQERDVPSEMFLGDILVQELDLWDPLRRSCARTISVEMFLHKDQILRDILIQELDPRARDILTQELHPWRTFFYKN